MQCRFGYKTPTIRPSRCAGEICCKSRSIFFLELSEIYNLVYFWHRLGKVKWRSNGRWLFGRLGWTCVANLSQRLAERLSYSGNILLARPRQDLHNVPILLRCINAEIRFHKTPSILSRLFACLRNLQLHFVRNITSSHLCLCPIRKSPFPKNRSKFSN